MTWLAVRRSRVRSRSQIFLGEDTDKGNGVALAGEATPAYATEFPWTAAPLAHIVDARLTTVASPRAALLA